MMVIRSYRLSATAARNNSIEKKTRDPIRGAWALLRMSAMGRKRTFASALKGGSRNFRAAASDTGANPTASQIVTLGALTPSIRRSAQSVGVLWWCITEEGLSAMPAKPAVNAAKEDQLRFPQAPGKSRERSIADLAVHPVVGAACTVKDFAKGGFGQVSSTELMEAMQEAVSSVKAGDPNGPEAILVSQAHALSAIFTELARRSAFNMGEYIEASEKYMRLALKAQAQCRATIETIATLKNPPVVFARQANISAGPQQVNNSTPPRAEIPSNRPSELLEEQAHVPRLDAGATPTPGSGNPELIPVEASDRTEDIGRQGLLQPQRVQRRPQSGAQGRSGPYAVSLMADMDAEVPC